MSIFDKYDLVDVDIPVSIPIMPESGVVLVLGSSGSGKTTILKDWGMAPVELDTDKPIHQLFNNDIEAEDYLITAGLRSVPCWRRTLSEVSNGEKHRAEIAVCLSKGDLFIDEFTSLVDRNTARALCESINKINKPLLVLSTCHKDILNWIKFDHAYDTDSGQWLDRGSVRRDSEIKISIEPCCPEAIWSVFKRHHYLSGKINKAANCWVAFYNGQPVAMTSVLAFPNAHWKDGWREHRTVVLPEFQGLGIGSAISDAIARHIVEQGARYFSKTSHPAFGRHREKSGNWRPTSKNKKARHDYGGSTKTKEDGHKMSHAHRNCFSHEYII